MKVLVSLILENMGYTIFNSVFLIMAILIYLIYRKVDRMDIYRIYPGRKMLYRISDMLVQSILVGLVISFIVVMLGVPLYFDSTLLLIMPISLVLGAIRLRFMDISYSAAVLGLLALVFNGQIVGGISLPSIKTHLPSLLILVALMKVSESLLFFVFGRKEVVTIVGKKDGKVAMGHVLQKNWLIPVSILVMQIGTATSSAGVQMPDWWPLIHYDVSNISGSLFFALFPFIGMLNYSGVTFVETPKAKTKQLSIAYLLSALIILILALLAIKVEFVGWIDLIIMPLSNECISWMQVRREKKKKSIYPLPNVGVRIMQVFENGYAYELGIQKGEVIEKFNYEWIEDLKQFARLIKQPQDQVVLNTRTMQGEVKEYVIKDARQLRQLGIRTLPENPVVFYAQGEYEHIGLFELLVHRYFFKK